MKDKPFVLFGYIYFLYVILSGILIIINTVVLGLGDPKFSVDGWKIYWPVWSVFYSPIMIVGIIIGITSGTRAKFKRQIYYFVLLLVITLVFMQVSLILDFQWPMIITEQLVLVITAIFGARYFLIEEV